MNVQTKNELLESFNAMRVANNDDAIVKFNATKAVLIETIDAYRVEHDIDDSMSIADLARELNMSPKIARAKLRRRGIYASNSHHARFERDDETYLAYVEIITTKRESKNA